MVNNLDQNFAMFRQMQQNQAGPSRPRANQAGPSRPREAAKIKNVSCKLCGANKSSFVMNINSGDTICRKCGAVQSNRRQEHQNAHVENGQVLYARVFVEEDQKIKLLVNTFFNVLFGDLRTETAAGMYIAQVYKEMKKYRARYVKKTNIQSAFKGLHMPTIVCCVLYCTLLKENRGMPLSIIVSIMNIALSKSRTEKTPVNLKTVYLYRTHKKYGFAAFFKLRKMKCFNNPLKPSEFISFTCNTILRIQDKDIHKMMKKIGDELFKEYPDITSPAFIATGVLFYIGDKLGSVDYKIFGLKKKELNDIKVKLEKSQNPQIIKLLAVL